MRNAILTEMFPIKLHCILALVAAENFIIGQPFSITSGKLSVYVSLGHAFMRTRWENANQYVILCSTLTYRTYAWISNFCWVSDLLTRADRLFCPYLALVTSAISRVEQLRHYDVYICHEPIVYNECLLKLRIFIQPWMIFTLTWQNIEITCQWFNRLGLF